MSYRDLYFPPPVYEVTYGGVPGADPIPVLSEFAVIPQHVWESMARDVTTVKNDAALADDVLDWLVAKWRSAVTLRGEKQAAKNFRKQGVPIELALRVRDVCRERHGV